MKSLKPVWQWGALIAASLALSFALKAAAFPAAFLLGAMLTGIAFGLKQAAVRVPRVGFLAAQSIIGCLVARALNPAILHSIAEDWAAMLLVIATTALALISMMFLMMVRVNDPLVPRATFGVLNTLLFFPSGAVYPTNGFPGWMKAISVVDPFTYAVHAFKSLLLKNTSLAAIGFDLAFLTVFTVVMMTLATLLFRRSL